MHNLHLRIKVGSALRPEEFPTQDFMETKVEEIVLLYLQTFFDFVETVTTDVDDVGIDNYEEPPVGDGPSAGRSELPEDLL